MAITPGTKLVRNNDMLYAPVGADEKIMATESDPVTLMQIVLWLQLLAVIGSVVAAGED